MENNKVKFFVDGKEVGLSIADIKIDKEIEGEGNGKFQFGNTYEGTLSNVEFGRELLNQIEKQRKLMKMQKARENLYKYID